MSAARRAVGALGLSVALCAGCTIDERSPPTKTPAAARAVTTGAPALATTAPAPALATTTPAAFPDRRGAGMAPPMVLRDFRRFAEVVPPAAQGDELLALRPEGIEHKVVAWGLQRQMRLTQPAPGAHQANLRFVTPAAGPALEAALVARLRAAGWLSADQGWAPIIAHPRLGHLEIDVKVPAERVTRVEFRLRRRDTAGPLEAPESLVTRPAWLTTWPVPPAGYEVGHWHDRPPHEGPTDLQVMSVVLPTRQPAVVRGALGAQLEAAGYTRDAEGIWGKGAATVAFADRRGGLLVVYQVYSKRASLPAAGKAPTPPPAPAVSGSSAPPR